MARYENFNITQLNVQDIVITRNQSNEATWNFGDSTDQVAFTEGTPAIAIYTTCDSTSASTSAEPFYFKSTMTGAAGVGGRARFHLYTNVALGGWSNALKAYAQYGASGSTAGMGSALCAEMALSAGTASGTYAPIEGELVLASGASTGTSTSFIYLNVSGAAASTFDTNGYLMEVGTGITPAAGKFASLTSHTLRCKVDGSTRYMVMSQTEDGIGLGTSGTPQVVTYNGTKPFSLYTTCASTDASTSYEPFLVSNTLTGAGQVGGRARFYMTANVALGGWSNALKAHVAYGSAGRTTGLGSSLCAEMTLSAGTTSGTYAPLESELVADSAVSTGTATSFLYCNIAGSNGTGITTINTNGYLFEIGAGIAGTTDGLFEAESKTGIAKTHTLRIRVDGTNYFIPLHTAKACGGS